MLFFPSVFVVTNPHRRLFIQGSWTISRSSCLVLLVLLLFGSWCSITGLAAEEELLSLGSGSTGAVGSSAATMLTPSAARSTELMDALARAVIERNVITAQRDSLLQQRWLIIAYAIFTSLLVGLFVRAHLLRRSGPANMETKLVVPVNAATRKCTNATITIRNATTQQAEITERVVTRRLFKAKSSPEVTVRVTPPSATIAKPISSVVKARTQVTTTAVTRKSIGVVIVAATKLAPANPARSNPHYDYSPNDAKPTKLVVGNRPSITVKTAAEMMVAVTKSALATAARSDPHYDYAPTDAMPTNQIIGHRPSITVKTAAEMMVAVTKSASATAARSDPHYDYAPTDAMPTNQIIGNRQSILLAPEIDDAVHETTQVNIAQGKGRILVRQGFSLLEVMIALAILATVLTSIGGGIFSLTSAKRSATEETAVSDLMRMWSERIMGGDWEWLGRNRSEDPLNGAWSWQRPETDVPLANGDFPPLREGVKEPNNDAAIQVLGTEHSGLADLHLYLEYYQPIALELCFTPIDGSAARSTWADTRNAYRLMPPIDLRKQIDAVVVRLSATWSSANGGTRRRELVFARVK